MSDVLLIDGNPDHVRPLEGLFKYRVSHDLEVVGDCVSGLRRVYGNPPDVILINALLFSSEDYGFPRALAEDAAHRTIRVIVLISGRLDEIRERSVEQYGATVLELPTSAGEISEAIETAGTLRSRSSEPQAVSWSSVAPEPKPDEGESTAVHPVAWESLGTEKASDDGVRPVSWPVDSGKPTNQPKQKPKKRAARASRTKPAKPIEPEQKVFKGGAETFQPAFKSGTDGFRPMSTPAQEPSKESNEESAPEPFKATDFKGLDDADPGRIKNR